jgi:hypothetical protein
MTAMAKTIVARPPMTPPTIAPVLDFFEATVESDAPVKSACPIRLIPVSNFQSLYYATNLGFE